MAITDLLPWKREEGKRLAVRRPENSVEDLYAQFERMFDDFLADPFSLGSPRGKSLYMGSFVPRVDVSENEKQVTVKAEVPGLDENDLQVSISKGVLTIYGEKQDEREEKDGRYHRIERAYGSFRRAIEMPCEVEEDNIAATFNKGVLKVVLPKSTHPEVLGRLIVVTKG
jgi:HSP20 family protein